jgi:nitrite reductase/ring-hydroxylating ferredoxin subunit
MDDEESMMTKFRSFDTDTLAGHGCEGCTLTQRAEPAIDRLGFLKQSAAALAAIALAACGSDGATAPSTLSSTTISLASNPKLATVGGVVTLSVDGSPVAVVRESTTTFAAFSLVCPHQGSTVQAQTSRFYCPGHGATFSLTGQWTGGERTSNLRSYPVTYDASAGTITIGG